MPTYTTNYNLAMYDNTTDITETFQSYRNEMCFTSGSNVTKIEAALTAQQSSIDSLELTKGDITVPAIFNAGSLFEASGISEITSYITGMVILLYLDQDSSGTVTLNINSLGVKSILKIDDSGSSVNLENNDLRINKRYEITYNGTAWIVVSTNYHIIQEEGTDVPQRDRIDFQGSAVLVQDSASATEVIISAITDVVDDTTPQLGGNLDMNGKNIEGVTPTEMGYVSGVTSAIQTQIDTKLENIVEDITPQLGGDLDLNGKNLNFPTTPNISDVLDEDNMVSDSATKLVTQQSIKAYVDNLPIELGFAMSDEDTDLETGTAKITFRMPFAMTLEDVRINVVTAPTGSTLVVDLNEGGVSVLSTKASIDIGEETSTTAATPPVISDANLADDAKMTADIDQIGSTIAGTGLKIWLIGKRV